MVTVYLRTIFMFFFLILALRVMGKRQVGELQVSELIVTFMLSELAVNPISNRDLPILYAVVPVLLLLSLEGIVSFLMLKSNVLKRLLYGRPTVVIRYGKILYPALRKHRVELDELLSELRQKGIARIEDISYAILERTANYPCFRAQSYPRSRRRMPHSSSRRAVLPTHSSSMARFCSRILPSAENRKPGYCAGSTNTKPPQRMCFCSHSMTAVRYFS